MADSNKNSVRFSSVSYWKQVFPPMIILIALFGIYMVYMDQSPMYTPWPRNTNFVRQTAIPGFKNIP